MTVGSLFSGIGGFDLGFERAGFEIRWQVEIHYFCRAVLRKHWPDVRRFYDVRTVGRHELEDVDVIVGGFPCKQTSVAAAPTGRRVGLAGADSGLWRHMLRVIGELQPRFAVVENPDSDALDQVSRDLAELGYGISRYEAEAWDFGAPHLRRRVFLVADAHGPRLAQSGALRPPALTSGQRAAIERNPWLQTLPRVCRVDDGLPGGVDRRERIQACGNAVIPAAAQWIAEVVAAMDQPVGGLRVDPVEGNG